jgi:hypothetical protein
MNWTKLVPRKTKPVIEAKLPSSQRSSALDYGDLADRTPPFQLGLQFVATPLSK